VQAIVFGPTIVFSGGAVQAANNEELMPKQPVVFPPPKPE
jgi:hypothetical protein